MTANQSSTTTKRTRRAASTPTTKPVSESVVESDEPTLTPAQKRAASVQKKKDDAIIAAAEAAALEAAAAALVETPEQRTLRLATRTESDAIATPALHVKLTGATAPINDAGFVVRKSNVRSKPDEIETAIRRIVAENPKGLNISWVDCLRTARWVDGIGCNYDKFSTDKNTRGYFPETIAKIRAERAEAELAKMTAAEKRAATVAAKKGEQRKSA